MAKHTNLVTTPTFKNRVRPNTTASAATIFFNSVISWAKHRNSLLKVLSWWSTASDRLLNPSAVVLSLTKILSESRTWQSIHFRCFHWYFCSINLVFKVYNVLSFVIRVAWNLSLPPTLRFYIFCTFWRGMICSSLI